MICTEAVAADIASTIHTLIWVSAIFGVGVAWFSWWLNDGALRLEWQWRAWRRHKRWQVAQITLFALIAFLAAFQLWELVFWVSITVIAVIALWKLSVWVVCKVITWGEA